MITKQARRVKSLSKRRRQEAKPQRKPPEELHIWELPGAPEAGGPRRRHRSPPRWDRGEQAGDRPGPRAAPGRCARPEGARCAHTCWGSGKGRAGPAEPHRDPGKRPLLAETFP